MNVAFIPVRGGSKSIPLKNIKNICDKPLVYWTAKAASDCGSIDVVYIATDSDIIKKTVEELDIPKVKVIGRSAESANDTASTESAMLEFAAQYDFDNIVLVQATSPLLTGEDLDRGFEIYSADDCDSVLSAVKQKRFNWNINSDGSAEPINYDYLKRPRRQEFDGYYTENGAFYITSKERLLSSKNRISGKIKICEMCEESFFEIDEPSDFEIIGGLLKKRTESRKSSAKIKLFLTDSDGCLTDGGMYYDNNGDAMKRFNAKDGMGMRLLRESGVVVGVITGEDIGSVKYRAEKIGMQEIHLGIKDKLSCIKEICERLGIKPEETAYVGDDVNDIEVLDYVGHPFTVPNCEKKVRDHASYMSKRCGGEGAIRDICEYIMEINNQ